MATTFDIPRVLPPRVAETDACPLVAALEPVPRLNPDAAHALLEHYDIGPRDGAGRLVVVAMSGGVDSAVAAVLLRERGYRVVGVNMRLYNPPDELGHHNPCCSLDAMEDARATCRRIEIPFYAMNMAKEFDTEVISRFVDEYANGRTPNPCLECNRHVKFTHLIAKARALGAHALATGHYARIEHDVDGVYQLYRALDETKDQSYVLHTLAQAQLAYLRFPLGRLRKTATRELARAFGLPVADKAESQDICFVGKGQYAEFVRRRRPALTEPGPIVNLRGTTLGEHGGLLRYTVGQRKGLGIAAAEPYFVIRLDVEANQLVVGTRSELGVVSAEAHTVTFTSERWPSAPFQCDALVRYRGTPYAATVEPLAAGRVRIHFADPPQAVAPGQAIVFYAGDQVLGGGTLATPRRPSIMLRPTG